MTDKPHNAPASGLSLGDIYFVLFRHKWKIISFAFLGILAAAAFYFLKPPAYQSEADLYIRYVLDNRAPKFGLNDSQMTSPDPRGDSIMNSEVAILSSMDLAQLVVSNVGPEKILARLGGGKDPFSAAAYVKAHLLVEVGKNSSIISLVFQHPDPAVVQPVLNNLIEVYFIRHRDIHQAAGMSYESLDAESGQLRTRLNQTDEDIKKQMDKAGVVSLPDAKKSYADQLAQLSQELLSAQVDLAEHQATLQALTDRAKLSTPVSNVTNTPPVATAAVEVTSAQTDQYRNLVTRLDQLWNKKNELLNQSFREESIPVKEVSDQIVEARAQKEKLEAQYPSLLALRLAVASTNGQPASGAFDLTAAAAQVAALETRTNILQFQLNRIQIQAARLAEIEPGVLELLRSRQNDENTYANLKTTMEQSRINDVFGEDKFPNISIIQKPSPPAPAPSKTLKVAGMLAVGGLAAGLALAFFIELYLDRSLKRPIEVENKLKLPLFLSIPYTGNGRHRLDGNLGRQLLKNGEQNGVVNGGSLEGSPPPRLEVPPWEDKHSLHSFYEALRDRLIFYFEVKNLTHKPKLLAVTSAGKGAGVTTIAMGLAASLSQTGDGNVLLVDMNIGTEAAHQFHKGKPVCGLDELLENGNRDGALVQENLYVVAESSVNGDNLPRILPKRFSNLLPKLKASDYDYIIFDMPPVSQISITPRLARFMDMVLFVAESEKTDLEVAKRATALLVESKANVGVVLNKNRTHTPRMLQQEL